MITATELDDGLVLDGEVYAVAETHQDFAICAKTGDHQHTAAWITPSRAAADRAGRLAKANGQCGAVLTRLVATTRWSPHP